jgi:glycosyltransferase involved in cell wall biosynthesis
LEDKRNSDTTGSSEAGDQQDKSQKSQSQPNQEQRSRKKFYYNRYRRRRFKPFNKQTDAVQIKTSFKKISIVIPLYNEEESIRPLYIEIKKALKTIACDYEVIFVDDGSTDKSLKNIKEIVRSDPKIKFISFRKNYGKSAALQIGFKNISGDVVITMDSDLQDDPGEVPNLVQKLEEGFDLVSGWKKKRYDPFIKRLSSKFFNFVTRIISGIKIHDFNCGLKAYRREVVQNLNVYGELHRYMPVLSNWQGFKISEIIVKHHPRRYGKTKFGISRFFKGFIDLLTVMFITRYVKRPMHLFGFLGALAFLVGLIVSGILTYQWISGQSLSNRPLLLFSVLLIIVGVQFFSVGLLGEIMVHNNQDDIVYDIKEKS